MPDIEACVGEASKVFVIPALAKNDADDAALPWAVTWLKLLIVRSTRAGGERGDVPMPEKESAPLEAYILAVSAPPLPLIVDVMVIPGRDREIRAEQLHAQRRGDGVLDAGGADDRGGVVAGGIDVGGEVREAGALERHARFGLGRGGRRHDQGGVAAGRAVEAGFDRRRRCRRCLGCC